MLNKKNKKPKHNYKGYFDYKNNILVKSWYWIKSLSILKHILVLYLFTMIIGSLLLFTPQAHMAGQHPSFVDSMFVAASAFSDTGLSSLTTATTWSIFGQAVIAILILVGGIGWFAIKVYFINILFGTPISFKTREALSAERGSGVLGSTRRMIKISVSIMFIVIVIASIVLTLYFYFVPGQMGGYDTSNIAKGSWGHGTPGTSIHNNQAVVGWNSHHLGRSADGNWGLSIRYGIFHAISALNNAGFDIVGSHSIQGFYHNYGLQIIFIVLFVIGGIGYPVIYDLYLWIRSKIFKETFKWSLFTKISMLAYVGVSTFGLAITFWIEMSSSGKTLSTGDHISSFWKSSQHGSKGDKTMALFFNTMSTRNAGFATIEMGGLSRATLILYTALMFIGSAPSSTAGGIRTTTIAVIFLGVWAKLRNRSNVRAFKKRIPSQTVTRSFVVFFVAFLIIIVVTVIGITSLAEYGGTANNGLSNWHAIYLEPIKGQAGKAIVTAVRYDFTEVLFEVGSAFGTTGLSTGLTSHLSLVTKLSLILVMFLGQLGISSSILVWGSKKSSEKHYSYVKEDVATG